MRSGATRRFRGILNQLGAVPAKRSFGEVAFRRGRRLLGLRLKMLTVGAAEVSGIAYYALLAERLPARSVAAIAAQIASEERTHLAFVRDLLDRAATSHPLVGVEVDGGVMRATLAFVALCGALAVCAEHRELIRMLGSSEVDFLMRCRVLLRGSRG